MVGDAEAQIVLVRVDPVFFAIPDVGIVEADPEIAHGHQFGAETEFKAVIMFAVRSSCCGAAEFGAAATDNTVGFQAPCVIIDEGQAGTEIDAPFVFFFEIDAAGIAVSGRPAVEAFERTVNAEAERDIKATKPPLGGRKNGGKRL